MSVATAEGWLDKWEIQAAGPRIAGRKLLIVGAVVDIIALSGIVLAQR